MKMLDCPDCGAPMIFKARNYWPDMWLCGPCGLKLLVVE